MSYHVPGKVADNAERLLQSVEVFLATKLDIPATTVGDLLDPTFTDTIKVAKQAASLQRTLHRSCLIEPTTSPTW